MHSQAELDPYYLALSGMASEETDGLTDTYCAWFEHLNIEIKNLWDSSENWTHEK